MPKTITITLDHDLGKDEARRRIEKGSEKLKDAFTGGVGGVAVNFSEEWVNEEKLAFAGRALGQKAHGEIDIFPQHVRITATLPTALAALAEVITGRLEKEGAAMLEHKKA